MNNYYLFKAYIVGILVYFYEKSKTKYFSWFFFQQKAKGNFSLMKISK